MGPLTVCMNCDFFLLGTLFGTLGLKVMTFSKPRMNGKLREKRSAGLWFEVTNC